MPRTHETLGPPPGVRTDPLAARRMLANVRARLFGAAPTPVRVGPYEVVRRLGAGSMGTVFEAYDPRLRRSVALKLVPIPEDDVVRDEMLREAQALARLRHPHVVAVFDAGVDELVWVAMQLLDGCDLQRWSTQPRSVAELLARLRDVGEGLAAVHQSGLVHRDVKPANAFVTRDGRACLVDFGLAVDVTDATTTTASSGVLRPSSRAPSIRGGGGTPAYMAPEQHRAELAGPASDQFAWCVMAWELLYGTRPFVAATVEGLLARKLEGALPRTPVRADVPREVHAVLLRGLAADPRERHADMRTLLDALPSASPSGSQRSVVVLAASALVVAFATTSRADVGGEGVCNEMVTPWGEHARAAVRDALVGDGDDAQRVATAERVDARLGELARAHADARATTCALRADAAIAPAVADRRLACLHRWHAELAALVDALRGPEASAEAWRWVAELDDPQRCLALDEPVLAREPQPPADVVAQVDAARLELLAAGTDLRRRELESARRRAEAVRRTATANGFLPLVAEADLELARIHRASGRVTDAEDALSEAYFGAHAARHGYVEVHAALEMIALVVNELGRPADAWRWLERARAVDAHGQPEIAVGLLAYEGLIRIALEDYAGAVAPLEEASKRARELGEDHPAHLSIVGNLVLALNGVARYDEAVTVAREHIAVQTRVLGSDHRELAATWHQLAIAAWELGDLATAHDAFTRSIALERRHRGERSFAVALGLFEVGRRAVAEADAVRAVELLDETAAILAELLDERHPLWTAVSFVRADAALLAGRPDEAVMWFERARVIGESTLGADHWIVAAAKAGTGRAALADGRAEQARTLLEPAWAELQATEDPQEPTADMAEVRFDLARARWQTGDQRSALALAEDTLAFVRAEPHPTMRRLASAIEAWLEERR